MKRQIVATIAVLIALVSANAGAAKVFPIGVWYEGGVGAFRNNLIPEDPAVAAAVYQRDFADMAAHGVNAAVVPNTQPNHHKVLLDAAQANGIKLIVELDKEGGELGQMVRGSLPVSSETIQKALDTKLKPVMSHPALWGVQLLDEPPAPSFGRYAEVLKALRAYAPGLQPFSCLIGSGGVESFSRISRQGVAAFDAYPLGGQTRIGDRQAMLNFDAEARDSVGGAAKSNTPVWAVIQAHSWSPHLRTPVRAELRCMTYLALANGCKGVWWFLYQTECNTDGSIMMQGLVDTEFKETELWQESGVLAGEIRKLSPIVLDLQPADGSVAVKSNALTHVLKDRSGRLYVAAVNTNTTAPLRLSVEVTRTGHSESPASVTKLLSGPIRTTSQSLVPGPISWSDTLAPGDGAFYAVK